ncbi:hypothetical protein ABZX77_02830 [Streptomyces sp. NPDC004237]|uniref:hypothetical protein n=1 Tax=Streptomyces sp. NPDC004237 TaxID=3154455 RepID=UPI0033A1AE53
MIDELPWFGTGVGRWARVRRGRGGLRWTIAQRSVGQPVRRAHEACGSTGRRAPLRRSAGPLPADRWRPHGLRKLCDGTERFSFEVNLPATCFPTASALGSTWNTDLLTEVGGETRAADVAVILGPGAYTKGSPLCGRNFEFLSEDLVTSDHLGASLVNGIQGDPCSACVGDKHLHLCPALQAVKPHGAVEAYGAADVLGPDGDGEASPMSPQYPGCGVGGCNPLVWCREEDRGPVFYIALGYVSEAYRDPDFLTHLRGGIASPRLANSGYTRQSRRARPGVATKGTQVRFGLGHELVSDRSRSHRSPSIGRAA